MKMSRPCLTNRILSRDVTNSPGRPDLTDLTQKFGNPVLLVLLLGGSSYRSEIKLALQQK